MSVQVSVESTHNDHERDNIVVARAAQGKLFVPPNFVCPPLVGMVNLGCAK